MTIFWDIDGVIRRLDLAVFGHEVDRWSYTNKNGLDLVEIVNSDPGICERAKPSEYLDFVNSLPRVRFLSSQLPSWQLFTDNWLDKYVTTRFEVIYTNDKLKYLTSGDFLIDDYPLFKDYSRIILVDRPYNKKTKCIYRVSKPRDLKWWYA